MPLAAEARRASRGRSPDREAGRAVIDLRATPDHAAVAGVSRWDTGRAAAASGGRASGARVQGPGRDGENDSGVPEDLLGGELAAVEDRGQRVGAAAVQPAGAPQVAQ